MTTRIGGISSGLETETIIKTLIDTEKVPLTHLEDKVAEDEEKLTQWTQLETKISDLQSTTSKLTDFSTWRQMTTSSSDTSKVAATVTGLSVDAATYNFNVSTLAEAHRVWGSTQSTGALGYSGTFTINGQEITVSASDTLTTIKDAINTASSSMASDYQVKAYIVDNKLVVENKKTGTGYNMAMSDTSGTVLQSLGILNGSGSYINEQASADLSGTINSVAFTAKSNTSVTSIVEGITFNFKDTGTSTLEVEKDTATIKTLIEDFITKYNDAMDLAQTQGTVQLSSSGEVSALGKLQGESLLANIQTGARSILSSQTSSTGDFNSLYKIGVWFSGEDNQISIVDEDKLDDALENNLDEVEDLFRSWGTKVEGQTQNVGQGIFRQLNDFLYKQIDPVQGNITLRTNNLESDISKLNTDITEKTNWLTEYENSLWEHFALMEEAVNNINSSGNYVLSSLGLS